MKTKLIILIFAICFTAFANVTDELKSQIQDTKRDIERARKEVDRTCRQMRTQQTERDRERAARDRNEARDRREILEQRLAYLQQRLHDETAPQTVELPPLQGPANPMEAKAIFLDPEQVQISIKSRDDTRPFSATSFTRQTIRHFVRVRNRSSVELTGLRIEYRADDAEIEEIPRRPGYRRIPSISPWRSETIRIIHHTEGLLVRVRLPLPDGQEAVREIRVTGE